LLVSHSRKDQIFNGRPVEDNLMDDGRGSTYVSGRMDIVAKMTEKNLILKGRAIGMTKIAIEQDEIGMLQLNAEKAESEANVRHVIEQDMKSDMERARLLAADEGIEVEAARSRIRTYREKMKAKGKNED
jgi:hypothetical protein